MTTKSFLQILARTAIVTADAMAKQAERQARAEQERREHEERVERAEQWAMNAADRARAQSPFYQAPAGAQVTTTVHTSRDLFGHTHSVVEQTVTLSPEQQELENMKQLIQGCRERCAASQYGFHKEFFMRRHFEAAERAVALWSMSLDSYSRKKDAQCAVKRLIQESA